MEKLQGTWKAVSSESDGAKLPDDITKLYLTVRNDEFTDEILWTLAVARSPSRSRSQRLPWTRQKPKAIDSEFNQGGKKVTSLGIYSLEGDTLKVCTSRPARAADPVREQGGFVVPDRV